MGSGVIHFNFDPRGDKWGSLLGDVRGVLLRSAPVFIGGQAGLVGPAHVDFGAVVAAGSIVRRDVPADCVHFDAAQARTVKGFDREIYPSVQRKFGSTARLIGNLWALAAWYQLVRLPVAEDYQKRLYEAAAEQARRHVAERIRRLEKIIDKLENSLGKSKDSAEPSRMETEHRLLISKRDAIVAALEEPASGAVPNMVLAEYRASRETMTHVEAVRALGDEAAQSAEAWLAGLADEPLRRFEAALNGTGSLAEPSK